MRKKSHSSDGKIKIFLLAVPCQDIANHTVKQGILNSYSETLHRALSHHRYRKASTHFYDDLFFQASTQIHHGNFHHPHRIAFIFPLRSLLRTAIAVTFSEFQSRTIYSLSRFACEWKRRKGGDESEMRIKIMRAIIQPRNCYGYCALWEMPLLLFCPS